VRSGTAIPRRALRCHRHLPANANPANSDNAIAAAGRRIDEHIALGYNFKFTDLQAVIGLAQMTKLDWRVQRKKELFALYQAELANVPEVTFVATNLSETSPWFIDVLVPDPAALRQFLHERGIGSRPFYPPIHTQAPYRESGSFPETERASRQGLWLPSSSFLEDRAVRRICDEIRAFYRRDRGTPP